MSSFQSAKFYQPNLPEQRRSAFVQEFRNKLIALEKNTKNLFRQIDTSEIQKILETAFQSISLTFSTVEKCGLVLHKRL